MDKICAYCKKDLIGKYSIFGGKNYHIACYENYIQLKCAHCKRNLIGQYTVSGGKNYHIACYENNLLPKCEWCKQNLTGQYTVFEGKNYHQSCYNTHIQLKCSYCKQGINGTYMLDDWGNKVCQAHQLKHCSSCGRIIIPTNTAVRPVNQRYYCGPCTGIAVNNPAPVPGSYQKILNYFNARCILNVLNATPISIVDNVTLQSKSSSGKDPDLRGLAQTTAIQHGWGGKKVFSHHIFILGGMPKIEFEAVFAHELLHTWLNQHDIKMSFQDNLWVNFKLNFKNILE